LAWFGDRNGLEGLLEERGALATMRGDQRFCLLNYPAGASLDPKTGKRTAASECGAAPAPQSLERKRGVILTGRHPSWGFLGVRGRKSSDRKRNGNAQGSRTKKGPITLKPRLMGNEDHQPQGGKKDWRWGKNPIPTPRRKLHPTWTTVLGAQAASSRTVWKQREKRSSSSRRTWRRGEKNSKVPGAREWRKPEKGQLASSIPDPEEKESRKNGRGLTGMARRDRLGKSPKSFKGPANLPPCGQQTAAIGLAALRLFSLWEGRAINPQPLEENGSNQKVKGGGYREERRDSTNNFVRGQKGCKPPIVRTWDRGTRE